jgi:hypothetical protein
MTIRRAVDKYSVPYLAGWAIRLGFRLLTSRWRTFPDFIIIGVQRGGTTSLYSYLATHPDVIPSFMKETHFFDNYYDRGMMWYRAQFPCKRCGNSAVPRRDGRWITGEATPYYIFYHHAPKRVLACVPHVKLIVLLRNPVDRAYSHYHHEVKMGTEQLSFEAALQREERELSSEEQKIKQNKSYRSFFHQHYTYVSRGIYVDQLMRWSTFCEREQILVLKSESFYRDPAAVLYQVTDFLCLSPLELREYERYNLNQYSPMQSATRERLLEYFESHNQRLYDFLGADLGWGK